MGYTHYFTQHKAATIGQWARIQDDFKKVAEHKDCPHIWGADYEDEASAPVIDGKEILFNGGHETMHVTRKPGPQNPWEKGEKGTFNFCKTARKPYDSAVVALLVIMAHHAPEAWEIGSDGETDEWQEGLELAQRATGNMELDVPDLNRD